MKKSERNLLVLLGIVVAVAAYYYISNMNPQEEYDELGLRVDSSERIADISIGARRMPELNIEELEAEKASFSGARRNLFVYSEAFSDSASEDTEEEDDSEDTSVYEVSVADDEEDEEPSRTRPRLAGYEYVGLHNEAESGSTAVFSWRGRMLVGRKGQIINETFEIMEITRKFVLIHVLEGDFEQRLQLKSPAGATSGGMK